MDNNKMNKIGVMIIGSKGAVATTFLAAQCAIKKGLDFNFHVPSENEPEYAHLPLINFENMAFAGWDIVDQTYSESCYYHKVVPIHVINEIKNLLDDVGIYPAIAASRDDVMNEIFESYSTTNRMKDVDFATTIFTKRPLKDLVKSLTYDIEDFRGKNRLDTIIVVNLASVEKSFSINDEHSTLDKFEKAIENNSPNISNGMVYAYAAINSGCHFINFTPSLIFEAEGIVELANKKKVILVGKDGKSGQTLYKTALAPLFKARGLKVTGWYSTNILGNRDGLVLNDPAHKEQKIKTKSNVLSSILGYDDIDHQVHIHYYKPRGDSKEAWDNIDFNGWFDVSMQMKIDWLGDDSILAAPLVYDLVRWVHFFASKGEYGIIPHLASYFKSPCGCNEHDLFKQIQLLKNHIINNYSD